jgi:hypothetical protein
MLGKYCASKGVVRIRIPLLSKEIHDKIKSNLTIHKKECVPYHDTQNTRIIRYRIVHTTTPLYTEDNTYIYVPCAFALQSIYLSNRIQMHEWDHLLQIRRNIAFDIHMKSSLRTEQINAVKSVMSCLDKVHGVCICAPCGFGKTVVALSIVCKIQMHTLIIVNTQSMQRQWKTRILEHIQGDIEQTIEICTIQAFLYNNAPSSIRLNPGLIIVDEAHFLPARVYRNVLSSSPIYLGCCYRIALTATPERQDNEHEWLFTHFGPIAFRGDVRIMNGTVCIIKHIHTMSFESMDYMRIMIKISKDESRNQLVLNCIRHALMQNRAILVLSLYVSQLSFLQSTWVSKYQPNQQNKACIYTMYGNNRTLPEDGRIESPCIIFATFALAKQGLDCPMLDTLILALPCKNVIQPTGRIMRTVHSHDIRVYDIHDNINMCTSGQTLRTQYYEKLQWKVKELNFTEKK